MITLTKKQRNILDFITHVIKSKGYSPTYREIAKKFHFSSVSTVYDHIRNLQKKGYLRYPKQDKSGINLADTARAASANSSTNIPLVGLITAGKPIEALEEKERLNVPAYIMRKGPHFALRVKGKSMIEDGILDGDYVIVKEENSADNGDIVVALLENQFATLKRFYKEKDHIRLQPANSSMEPFRVKNVKIQGLVVGLIRRYSR